MKRKLKLKRWHYWVAAAFGLLLIGCIVVFINREGIKFHVNSWRASALLEDSQSAAESGDWKESERLALAAWQLNEGNYDALKQLYHSAVQERSRYILASSRMLFAHPEATTDDRFEVLNLYLRIGDLTTFKALFGALESEEQVLPEAMALGVRFLYARRDFPRAITLANELLKVRGSMEDKLLTAEILSRTPSDDRNLKSQAQQFILELFHSNESPRVSLAAFQLLRNIAPSHWQLSRFSGAKERLDEIAASSFDIPSSVFLLVREIEIQQFPDRREEILEETVEQWLGQDSVALCEWLLQSGESKRVLKIVDEENYQASNDLYRIVVLASITQKDWPLAEKLLRSPHPQMKPSIILGLQAAIAQQQNQMARANSLWLQALNQAELATGQGALLELAKLASRAGNAEVRNRAVTEALKRPSAVNLPASDVAFLFEELAENDEPEDLLTVSSNLLRSDPENPVLINNVVWLELIMGRPRQDYTVLLKGLVEKFPNIPPLRSTLALALMETGNDEEALATMIPTFGAATARRENSTATDMAIIALAFARNGDVQQAQPIFQRIEWGEMMEVEKEFFQSAYALAINPPDEDSLDPQN